MKEEKIKETLSNMLKARFPIIYINTWEEGRIEKLINEIFESDSKKYKISKREIFVWSQTSGALNNSNFNGEKLKQAMSILDHIEQYDNSSVFILKDFHVFFTPNSKLYDYNVIRKLRDIIPKITTDYNSKSIIITSPITSLPLELQKDVAILDFDLPNIDEIVGVMERLIQDNEGHIQINLNEDEKLKLCKAAVGLTLQEAENAFAKSIVIDGRLSIDDLDIILEEKSQIIKKSGILEYIKTDVKTDDVGGLENLKKWLNIRTKSWKEEAKKYNITPPKGVLVTGVPGCGKSLIAKAISDLWKMPLLRLDMGSVFSSLLGSSEENMRKAIKTAEAISPSILWIDEIEKGFSGVGGSNDSGVSSRIFGSFLTWMQEKTSNVFVVATANNINALPSEFLRKGRFDEIFFVDLPTKQERKDIFKVHLNKKLKNSVLENSLIIDENLLEHLSNITEGFVGAEIESIVSNVIFEAFNENRNIEINDFNKIIKYSVPLSITQAEQIIKIREWANVRAVAATKNEDRNEYIKEEKNTIQISEQMNKARGGRTVEF